MQLVQRFPFENPRSVFIRVVTLLFLLFPSCDLQRRCFSRELRVLFLSKSEKTRENSLTLRARRNASKLSKRYASKLSMMILILLTREDEHNERGQNAQNKRRPRRQKRRHSCGRESASRKYLFFCVLRVERVRFLLDLRLFLSWCYKCVWLKM